MGLKRLVGALLPVEYREQVLGDLQERGFQVGDVVSVLPRVWWSHTRRSFTGVSLAGASEEAIGRRARQFWLRRNSTFLFFAACSAIYPLGAFMQWLGLIVFAGALVQFFYMPRRLRNLTALERHRTIVTMWANMAQFGFPYLLLVHAATRYLQQYLGHRPAPVALIGIPLCFAYGYFRSGRLQKEIDSLP